MTPTGYAIGLMSGTSLDGIDAVAISASPATRTLAHAGVTMPGGLKAMLAELCTPLQPGQAPTRDPIDLLGTARRELTDLYAAAVAALPADIRRGASVIGAHGQTVRHRPEQSFSLQILDGARLAEVTGLTVVTDFRSADLAAGGQGAPLAPIFHQVMLAPGPNAGAIVNIGGIANITILGPSTSTGGSRPIIAGFDTGPGNRLLDDWCELHRGEAFDRDGCWGATGRSNHQLLATFLKDPYFELPAPKSTGREDFSLKWLQQTLSVFERDNGAVKPVDVQATLVELTAISIAAAAKPFEPRDLVVCGGGAANPELMRSLAGRLPGGCASSATVGIDPQQVEAAAFAWLAQQRLALRALDLTAATGAKAPRILGAVYPAPAR